MREATGSCAIRILLAIVPCECGPAKLAWSGDERDGTVTTRRAAAGGPEALANVNPDGNLRQIREALMQ